MHPIKISALFMIMALPAMAQFTYPGCANLAPTDFDMTELFSRTGVGALATNANMVEPVQMDLRYNGTAVDVYFVERRGAVKYYNGAARTVTQIGTIPNWANTAGGSNDNGLMGIAIDPNFTTNRMLYFWYSPVIASATLNRRLRLSRIPVSAGNTLTMGSEQILIDIIGSKTDQWHSGGPMQFDSYGDLWITVGNNSRDVETSPGSQYSTTDSSLSAEWGSSNTASMRGGILRIHPEVNLVNGKYYSIPAGNFGEYWATQFQNQGNAALAAEYRNPALVLPEVYVKGSRSNFSISVHPTRRWLAWAEVNYQSTNDEFNISNRPIFAGFPYFHANNASVPGNTKSIATPMNTSPLNSGVQQLPPAIPGNINNLMNVAISGPIYAYDRNNLSPTKFPPHLNNTLILTSYQANQVHITRIDSNAVTLSGTQRADNSIFNGIFVVRNPISARYGPDGALYILNYSGGTYGAPVNPSVMRVNYIGACTVTPITEGRRSPTGFAIIMGLDGVKVNEPGNHEIGLYDLAGHKLFSQQGGIGAEYSFAGMRKDSRMDKGLYVVRIKTERGLYVRNISLF